MIIVIELTKPLNNAEHGESFFIKEETPKWMLGRFIINKVLGLKPLEVRTHV
jgi:hypothetical protein